MDDDRSWQAVFDTAFREVRDDVQRRIWRAVFGDDYPEGVDPYSYVSLSELHQLRDSLRVDDGDVFGDLGCGRGGPGLWLAARTGADLVGIDISQVALEAATERAATLGLTGKARYQHGSFADTGLPTASLDAIVSVDALIFAPDKSAAIAELARVLRPGGRLAITTWDYHRQPAGRPPQLDDHRPVLAEQGFTVRCYTETVDWRRRVTAVSDALIEHSEEIAAESGLDVQPFAPATRRCDARSTT
jgi:SAM-dependent methyltransferase